MHSAVLSFNVLFYFIKSKNACFFWGGGGKGGIKNYGGEVLVPIGKKRVMIARERGKFWT